MLHTSRDAFGVSEKEHVQIQSEVESVILDSVTNFNAIIKVKGIDNFFYSYYIGWLTIKAPMCVCVCVFYSGLCTQLKNKRGRLVSS